MELERIKYNRKLIESGDAIYIGRGFFYHDIPRSKWCNPFEVNKYGLDEALRLFREYITQGNGMHLLNDLHELSNKKIACHCPIDSPCHGDIIIQLLKSKLI